MEFGNPIFHDVKLKTATTTFSPIGTGVKTGVFLSVLAIAFALSWSYIVNDVRLVETMPGDVSITIPPKAYALFTLGLFGGFITAMITIFHEKIAMVTGFIYSAFEGIVLGLISCAFNARFPGIALQAVLLTFGVLFIMLILYTSRIIKITPGIISGIISAMGAILIVYIAEIILSMFGMEVPFINETGWVGIGISLVIVGIASFNLCIDFYQIEEWSHERAPKYMEWYAAFGIMVSLVWLYLEILRLLEKLKRD